MKAEFDFGLQTFSMVVGILDLISRARPAIKRCPPTKTTPLRRLSQQQLHYIIYMSYGKSVCGKMLVVGISRAYGIHGL